MRPTVFNLTYATPLMARLRSLPGASVCVDEDCELSGGFAHIGPCEPCGCGHEHAIEECPVGQYVCYICEQVTRDSVGEGFVRRPLNWTKDKNGMDRCPKHSQQAPTLATLGDMLRAKEGRR